MSVILQQLQQKPKNPSLKPLKSQSFKVVVRIQQDFTKANK